MNKKEFSRREFLVKTGAAMSVAAAGSLLLPSFAKAGLASTNMPVENTGKMKWCMYTYSIFGGRFSIKELDIVEMCRKTKELGIDGLDIISAGYNRSWEEIRKIADDHGIKVVCYTRGVKELESTDEATINLGIDEFKKRLEVAHILGSNRIMMNMGGTTPDRHENRKNLIKSLERVLPIAKAEGIEVTIEHHNNPKAPFRTSADFDEALATVPDLRIAYDSGNIHIAGEDSVQGYKNNQDQITHMHFKDFSENGRLCIPGQGIIDFPNLIKAMKAANYTGYINLETPMKEPGGYECHAKAIELLGPLIA